MICAVTFDFDGTLVDSESCLPFVFSKILELFSIDDRNKKVLTKLLISREEYYHWEGIFEYKKRIQFWKNTFYKFGIYIDDESFDGIFDIYWIHRIAQTKIRPYTKELLEFLKERSIKLAVVAGNDERVGLKRFRVKQSGLDKYFDEILIAKDDVLSKKDAVERLAEKWGCKTSQIVHVDDKDSSIEEANSAGALTIQIKHIGILKMGFEEFDNPTYKANDLKEVKEILTKILEKRVNKST